ncbi:hypothetical protein M405DRAFT_868635 [Rhizopogon salebrosus TDB-379]|nr:hypothetical protein M405DRAFT_868635 [Rhizopogon salebrosus TDB-379]
MGMVDGQHTIGDIPWAPWMGGIPLAADHGHHGWAAYHWRQTMVLYSRHTIWVADGMWHWYEMIVQPGNHTTGRHWTV